MVCNIDLVAANDDLVTNDLMVANHDLVINDLMTCIMNLGGATLMLPTNGVGSYK
jgi:hypothetical protein